MLVWREGWHSPWQTSITKNLHRMLIYRCLGMYAATCFLLFYIPTGLWDWAIHSLASGVSCRVISWEPPLIDVSLFILECPLMAVGQ